MGLNYLSDVLTTMGQHIDCLKFAGGSFTLMPADQVKAITDLCHKHQVSGRGFLHVIPMSELLEVLSNCWGEVSFEAMQSSM